MDQEKTIYDVANFNSVTNYIMSRIDEEIPKTIDKKYEQQIDQAIHKYMDSEKKDIEILASDILDITSAISYYYFSAGMHVGARLLLELLDL